jgi:CPA1 family monovalent cation:H+ antiporter
MVARRKGAGAESTGTILKQALVTTLAGPKGAVTLSIILTLPMTLNTGEPLPMRNQIIFITSGVILCTLLLANFLLPMLSPKEERAEDGAALSRARILVLDKTVKALRKVLAENAEEDFAPALRLTLMRYRVRLMRERLSMESCGRKLGAMIVEVLDVQQARADEIQKDAHHIPEIQRLDYYSILQEIRSSIGYFSGAEKVGSRFETSKGRIMMKLLGWKKKTKDYDDEKKARIYFDTVIFALDLEYTAIRYLQGICESENPERARVAKVLLEEHEASLQSLWGRINYGQKVKLEEVDEFVHTIGHQLPEGMQNRTMEQFHKARAFNDEADANAMQVEMDKILECRLDGSITEAESWALREEVYLMQTAMLE